MCIPHGVAQKKRSAPVKKKRTPKSVKRVSQDIFEKGDPDFVDERVVPYEPEEKKKGLFSSLFGL